MAMATKDPNFPIIQLKNNENDSKFGMADR